METRIVFFTNMNENYTTEIEVPVHITANDLIYALNEAFQLGLDQEDIFDNYLVMENPIAFLKGNRTLGEYDIRNGSNVIFKRDEK